MLSKFEIGYVIACCNIVMTHEDDIIATEVLMELGKTRDQILNGNDWDAADRAILDRIFSSCAEYWVK